MSRGHQSTALPLPTHHCRDALVIFHPALDRIEAYFTPIGITPERSVDHFVAHRLLLFLPPSADRLGAPGYGFPLANHFGNAFPTVVRQR